MKPLLIIVTGPPCSGKTTLARRIAEEFHLPLITKDGIKETLFDTLGWSDRAWSKKLGNASYELLFYFMRAQLAAGRLHIVEANFYPAHAPRLLALREDFDFHALQIFCHADAEILLQRYRARWARGERHPGHGDDGIMDEFRHTLRDGRERILEIGGTVVEFDTTDFERINYAEIFRAIHSVMEQQSIFAQ
jgi:predicted kinase